MNRTSHAKVFRRDQFGNSLTEHQVAMLCAVDRYCAQHRGDPISSAQLARTLEMRAQHVRVRIDSLAIRDFFQADLVNRQIFVWITPVGRACVAHLLGDDAAKYDGLREAA